MELENIIEIQEIRKILSDTPYLIFFNDMCDMLKEKGDKHIELLLQDDFFQDDIIIVDSDSSEEWDT